MANPALGAKQICPTCASKFYDLGRRPAVCPKCGAEFDPEEAMRNRRVRVRALTPEDETEEKEVAAPAEAEDGFEAEPDDAPELDQVVDEPPLITDEDSEEADPAAPAAPADDIGVDFTEEEDLAGTDDTDVPFIEDDDEDFDEDDLDGLGPDEGGEEG